MRTCIFNKPVLLLEISQCLWIISELKWKNELLWLSLIKKVMNHFAREIHLKEDFEILKSDVVYWLAIRY